MFTLLRAAVAPATLALSIGAFSISMSAGAQDYTLRILHTNDVHARVDQVTRSGSYCTPKDATDKKCFGGYARIYSKIQELRASAPNVLVLDAGDRFQGSLFYTKAKGDALKPFVNRMGYDAIIFGNHEFDDGVPEIAKFFDGLQPPLLTANVNVDQEPSLQRRFAPSMVIEVGGQSIGVIGLVTPDTPTLASPGKVKFLPLKQTLQAEVNKMKAAKINKIIVLSHIGEAEDEKLAKTVDGVDIFVGGHSHTLLSNTDAAAEGKYPIVVKQPSGAPSLIVQAYYASIFLGHLDATFDNNGVLTKWEGNPILLDSSVPQDAAVQAMVNEMAKPLAELRTQAVGEAKVELNGDRAVCRHVECNLGNLIADSLLWKTKNEGTQVAIQNGGGIRTSIPKGQITFGNVLEVLPFSNTVSTFKLTGAELWAALENGVSKAEDAKNEGTGRFAQVAGARYTWSAKQPAGKRITKVEIRQADGSYKPLDTKASYRIVTNDFVRTGGDGYAMFKTKATDVRDGGANLEDVLRDYIKSQQGGAVEPKVEGRITRAD